MKRILIATLGAALAAAGSGAWAQTPNNASCAALDTALPADLAAWTQRQVVTSATGAASLPQAVLTPGQAATVTLHPTQAVTYVVQPGRPGGPATQGGLLALTVTEAGPYRFVLSAGAWIDVLSDGRALVSTGHAHGPPCSTARKTVTFDLKPGRYVIQLSGNADATIGALVHRQP